jgi:hypothetical protein
MFAAGLVLKFQEARPPDAAASFMVLYSSSSYCCPRGVQVHRGSSSTWRGVLPCSQLQAAWYIQRLQGCEDQQQGWQLCRHQLACPVRIPYLQTRFCSCLGLDPVLSSATACAIALLAPYPSAGGRLHTSAWHAWSPK